MAIVRSIDFRQHRDAEHIRALNKEIAILEVKAARNEERFRRYTVGLFLLQAILIGIYLWLS